MRMLAGAMALGLLVGCAGHSMDQARTAAPYKTFTSDKKDQLVAQCIQFAWQDETMFGVDGAAYLQPGPTGGFTVYTRSSEYFIDVVTGPSGTTINYYVVDGDALAERRLGVLATCL
ncbi:MAG: hypothetical protein JWP80_650 [Pseudomonas sp.]|nr:hypothetical protein [Pseudomonas sp.]